MGLNNTVITVTPVTNENIKNNMMNDKKEISDVTITAMCNLLPNKYVRHCVITHANKTAFPSLVEIEKYGLKPQGKRWETPSLI